MKQISPNIQNQITMLQQMQQQMQTFASQRGQYDLAVQEAKRALEELSDLTEERAVFITIGTVMMQKPKEYVVSQLNERVETLEIRIRSIEKQEKMVQEKFETLQAQVKAAIEGRPPIVAE